MTLEQGMSRRQGVGLRRRSDFSYRVNWENDCYESLSHLLACTLWIYAEFDVENPHAGDCELLYHIENLSVLDIRRSYHTVIVESLWSNTNSHKSLYAVVPQSNLLQLMFPTCALSNAKHTSPAAETPGLRFGANTCRFRSTKSKIVCT